MLAHGSDIGDRMTRSWSHQRVLVARGGRLPAIALLVVAVLVMSGCGGGGTSFSHSVAVADPLPSGYQVNAMACPTPSVCFAAVTVSPPPGSTQGEPVGRLMQWDGRTWAMIPATPTTSTGAPGALSGVACGSAAACVAVGSSDHGPFALAWNGRTWRVAEVPMPPGRTRTPRPSANSNHRESVILSAVSCYSATGCVAVGSSEYLTVDTPNADLFAVQWDGTSWARSPLAPGPGDQTLSGIACPGARVCMAVGATLADVEGLQPAPLIERWDGATWAAMPVAVPAGPEGSGELAGISCPSVTSCMAVGVGPQGPSAVMPSLAVVFGHGSWEKVATPPGEGLGGVACPAPGQCVAVGSSYDHQGNNEVPLVAAYVGAWTAITSTGVPFGLLYAVACPTDNTCLSGGLSLLTSIRRVA